MYVYIQGVIGELSKLHKIKNDTDISLHLIYFPKLHKNILKFYRLNLYKEIPLASTIAFNVFGISNKPFGPSPCLNCDVLLLSLLSSYLLCCTQFCWSLTQLHPKIIIKGIAIWRVSQPDVRVIWSQKFSYSQHWVVMLMLHWCCS